MKKVFLFSLVYLLSVVTVVAQQKDNKQQVQKQKLKTLKYHQGTGQFLEKLLIRKGSTWLE